METLVYSPADILRGLSNLKQRGVRDVELESRSPDGKLRTIWFALD